MLNRFEKEIAKSLKDDLDIRVYTSNLLGADEDLVLSGGGNTSVKIGDKLYVKGSGWSLDRIERKGFPAVDLKTLKDMAKLESLSDSEMVKLQREAMESQDAPNPSVEAILHAVIPYKFVEHTHADAVVTISNTPDGKRLLEDIYGDRVLIVDYVMPGFILAKEVFEQIKDIDLSKIDAIILLNHGVFTFSDDARVSYSKMVEIVDLAQKFLSKFEIEFKSIKKELSSATLKAIEEAISKARGVQTLVKLNQSRYLVELSNLPNLEHTLLRGNLTPEHVLKIKPKPVILEQDFLSEIESFKASYIEYFNRYRTSETMLEPYPKYAILRGYGAVIFGDTQRELNSIEKIVEHTARAILYADRIGGWQSLSESEIFQIEYWELEQAKLKR